MVKKMWHSIKTFFGRLLLFVYAYSRIYSVWSKLYQYLFQRDYRKPLPIHSGFSSIVNTLRGGKLYRFDGLRELGDAISHPEYVQWVVDSGEAPMGMDCDEHAIYIVAAVKMSLQMDAFIDTSVKNAELLTVGWIDRSGGYGGHNVALITSRSYTTSYSYMDYGFPSKSRASVNEVVADIVHRYGGAGSQSLGWSIQDEKLRVKKVGWK